MTEEQIIQIARSSELDEFWGTTDEGINERYWEGWDPQFIKFAQTIYQKGLNEGYVQGYNVAREEFSPD